jgi:hypothetical protein
MLAGPPGCGGGGPRRDVGRGDAEAEPEAPVYADAPDDGTFIRDLGAGEGPGRWPGGTLPAIWQVSRIGDNGPAAVDAAADAPAEVDAGAGGAGEDPDAGGDGGGDDTGDGAGARDAPPPPEVLPGQPPAPGQARAEGDTFAITGAGTGVPITGAQDDFLFVHRPLVGDGAILALLRTTAGCPAGRIDAGVMMRTSVAGDASFGLAGITGAGGGGTLMSRASAGFFTNVLRFDGAPALPLWLKVERHGARLRIGYSRDGRGWTEAERDLFDAPLVIEAGLVAAATAGDGCSVLFERVALIAASAQGP